MFSSYVPISQMTFQPKNVGKMAGFEIVTPLYLPKFKSSVYIFFVVCIW